MKILTIIFCLCLLTSCSEKNPKEKLSLRINTYEILHSTTSPSGEVMLVYNSEIDSLPEHLKAMTALYAAIAGTNCCFDFCELTMALGLGEQGSEAHKKLIMKYFPTYKVARDVLDQNCYLTPRGSSVFSEYDFLKIIEKSDTVVVNFKIYNINKQDIDTLEGQDIFLFKDTIFRNINL